MVTGPQQLARLLQPQVQVVSGRRTTQTALEQPFKMSPGNAHGVGQFVDTQRSAQVLVH
jgi:hypothetical protein